MAAVKIIRPPICSDPATEIPREQWPELIAERKNFCNGVLPRDCRMLLFFVDDAEKSDWLGYGSREQYLRDALGLDPQQVTWAIDGLRQLKPDEPIAYDWAQKLGKREIGVEGGKPGPGRGKKTGDNITRFERGTSRAYILARLDRDGLTDLAAKVRAGELSANAAATQAGWRKKPTITCPECGHKFTK